MTLNFNELKKNKEIQEKIKNNIKSSEKELEEVNNEILWFYNDEEEKEVEKNEKNEEKENYEVEKQEIWFKEYFNSIKNLINNPYKFEYENDWLDIEKELNIITLNSINLNKINSLSKEEILLLATEINNILENKIKISKYFLDKFLVEIFELDKQEIAKLNFILNVILNELKTEIYKNEILESYLKWQILLKLKEKNDFVSKQEVDNEFIKNKWQILILKKQILNYILNLIENSTSILKTALFNKN